MNQIIEKPMYSNFSNPSRGLVFPNLKRLSPARKLPFHESAQADFYYEKTYFCQTLQDLELIKSRSTIKNQFLPKFQIISETANLITVKMKKYSLCGLTQLALDWNKPQLAQSTITSILRAIQLLQNSFGTFQLSEGKIKSDAAGNIVVWLSQDFQQCFPFSPKKIIKMSHDTLSSKLKVENHLQKLKVLMTRVILKKSFNIDIKKLNDQFNIIKKKSLLKSFNSFSRNQSPSTKTSFQSRSKFHFKSQGDLKSLFEIQSRRSPQSPYMNASPSTNTSPTKKTILNLTCIKTSQVQKYQNARVQRFSYFQNSVKKNLRFGISPQIIQPRRSEQDYTQHATEQKNKLKQLKSPKHIDFPTDFKIPKFIKLRQKVKGDNKNNAKMSQDVNRQRIVKKMPIMSLDNIRRQQSKQKEEVTLKRLQVKDCLKVPKINSIYNFRQQVSMQIDPHQQQQLLNNDEDDLIGKNLLNVKYRFSCTEGQDLKLARNRQLFSLQEKPKQKQRQKGFFLSNLSLKQQSQLQQDFEKIFLSRRITDADIMGENEELKKQLMLLID